MVSCISPSDAASSYTAMETHKNWSNITNGTYQHLQDTLHGIQPVDTEDTFCMEEEKRCQKHNILSLLPRTRWPLNMRFSGQTSPLWPQERLNLVRNSRCIGYEDSNLCICRTSHDEFGFKERQSIWSIEAAYSWEQSHNTKNKWKLNKENICSSDLTVLVTVYRWTLCYEHLVG